MPVEAGNDANVAALGEAWQGGAKGYEDVVVVTLGTGVGGGIIINGKMVAGATGAAGEIGHMHVNDDETEPCNCGNCGCLEEYVSATGIVRMAKRKLAEDDRPSLMRKDDLSAKDVWDAVKAGDTVAIEVAEDFGWVSGQGDGAGCQCFQPGDLRNRRRCFQSGNVLLDYIQKYYQKYAFKGCVVHCLPWQLWAMTLVFTRCQTGVEIIPVSSAKDPHKITTYPAQSRSRRAGQDI